MSRGTLIVALLVSVGVNLGLVGTAVARKRLFEHRPSFVGSATDRTPSRPDDRAPETAAAGDRRPDAPPDETIGEQLADRLDLEGDRRVRFVAAQRRMATDVGAARIEIRRVRDDLRHEIGAPVPDRPRIEALLGELARAEERVNHAFVTGILEVRSELDPEESRRLLWLIAEYGLGRQGGESGAFRAGPGGPPFGRRFGAERRPPSHESQPAAPAPPGARP